MKQLFVRVMLVCITTASSVFADVLDSGLGADRSRLSFEQIAARSERLEASTTFSLLRYPEAMRAPSRIFSAQIWRYILTAASEHDLDPMMLAGMIFIESYGDPKAKSPTGPAGLAQLTKASAREMGLSTGKKVRIGTKAVKKTQWVGKGKTRRKVVRTVQQPVYKTIDERYVPERAISAMARRISNRRAWLGGKLDFAVAEYHMGAGRMAKLLSVYFGRTLRVSDVPAEMRDADLTYTELFWTNTPYYRPEVYQALEDLNRVDYSPTYYFRVRQAMRLLDMYRKSPGAYAELASSYQGRLGWAVLPNWQWSFVDAAEVDVEAIGQHFVAMPDIAPLFGVRTDDRAMSAEPSTIGSALFVAHHLRRLQGERYSGFELTRIREEPSEPLHSLGWAFDIPFATLSRTEKRDLKFILTDLRHAGLLTYVEEDESHPVFHVVRHPDHAARFEQFYLDAVGGSLPGGEPRLASSGGATSLD